MIKGKTILVVLILSGLFSCVSHKKLLSVQDSKENPVSHNQALYLLQTGDILDIKVSSMDPQSVAIFNKEIGGTLSNQVNPASIYLNGYSINDSGYISLPLIGNIQVKGLAIMQVKDSIENKMKFYFKYASVDVKLMSFQVTVLGEVISQGSISIFRDEANILQVIGMAGGITDLGDRKKIRVIRKIENHSQLAYIDISRSDIIGSEYYYVQPNDIIYVEPLKAKSLRVNALAVQVALSALTFIIVVLNFINKP